MPAGILQWEGKEEHRPERLEERKQKIAEELADCPGIEKRWMKKLETFLVQSGIEHISEMDYPLGSEYEIYLDATPQWKKNCLRSFDKVMFRHYYGVKLTELHLDDWMIARLLGHKGLNSVKHYRKMSNQLMADETRKVREMLTEIIYANLDGWGAEYEQIRQNDRGK